MTPHPARFARHPPDRSLRSRGEGKALRQAAEAARWRKMKLAGDLTAKGIKNTWHPSDGAHTWIVWRKYLAEVAPLLFR